MTQTPVIWQPPPPSKGRQLSAQALFLCCPIQEALAEGGRGGGKTIILLLDYAKDVGCGFGILWRGVLFRQTYKQLDDVVSKSQLLFRQMYPQAKFNESDYEWNWPTGERLLFRYIDKASDYWNYHGWEIPWLGFEELTNWGTSTCYEMMLSCNRSSHPGIAKRKRIRSTTNPYGAGHGWVKHYFVDPAPEGVPVTDEKTKRKRVRIFVPTEENIFLHEADPNYIANLEGIEDENLRKAWRGKEDRWEISAGAFFTDIWSAKHHILNPFKIPASWRLSRAFDWGSSRPFSVGWYAESDGDQIEIAPGVFRTFPRGTLFRIAEWYGWNGKPNEGVRMLAKEIAKGIKEREGQFSGQLWPIGARVQPGPADSSIWDNENGVCIATDMASLGITWERADKSPGSRKQGWERCRSMLSAAKKTPLEEAGFFVFSSCRQFLRTVPVAVRDERDPDDVDSNQEDHILDEWRYRVLAIKKEAKHRDLA